jgi:micrococcal nuclease
MFEYMARVLEVIDGDTIDVSVDLGFSVQHTIRIRLYGINTPETRTRNKEEKQKGLAAKARLKELVEGKFVSIKTKKDNTEKFGRYLAEIYLDNTNINQTLITEGHAQPYFGEKRT